MSEATGIARGLAGQSDGAQAPARGISLPHAVRRTVAKRGNGCTLESVGAWAKGREIHPPRKGSVTGWQSAAMKGGGDSRRDGVAEAPERGSLLQGRALAQSQDGPRAVPVPDGQIPARGRGMSIPPGLPEETGATRGRASGGHREMTRGARR